MQEVDTHRRAGRPNIQGTGKEKNKLFRIKLSECQKGRLGYLAESEGCTPTQLVRQLIHKHDPNFDWG
jgi:hypothetical protein